MLNKETLRYKIDAEVITPWFVKPAGVLLAVTESLLEYWKSQVGQSKNDIYEGLTPHLYQAKNLMVSRGINKLIEDRCVFTDPAGQQEFREAAFTSSATLLKSPRADVREYHKQIAQNLGVSPKELYDNLYADLPQAAVLEQACQLSAKQLIQTYNMAQAQGLLIYAQNLKVAIIETDIGFRRKLLKALRFQRLLANIQQDETGNLLLSVSGPAAVLDQHQRYGLNLAQFLPAIACAKSWAIVADIRCPRNERRSTVQLSLNESSGLVGENKFLGYIPEEQQLLLQNLQEKCTDWRCHDQAPLLVIDKGEIIVPDIQIQTAEATYSIEFFHRWHSAPLKRRLEQLRSGQAPKLLIGVDRSIVKRKEFAELAHDPMLEQRGFLFSSYPSLSAIKKCVSAQPA